MIAGGIYVVDMEIVAHCDPIGGTWLGGPVAIGRGWAFNAIEV
jgi:hypothetical protein